MEPCLQICLKISTVYHMTFSLQRIAAYGFDYNSLKMLQSYLSNRKQGKKKLMMLIVSIVTFCSEFHKALYLGYCYLIFIDVTSFMILMIAISQVILMIIPLTQVAAI